MPLFCSNCNNLMVITTTADTFNYKCNSCYNIELPTNEDSLVYKDVTGINLTVYKSILYNAGKDPVNPKVQRLCKCGNEFARQVRLGTEMKLINTCTVCSEQWLDGTNNDSIEE